MGQLPPPMPAVHRNEINNFALNWAPRGAPSPTGSAIKIGNYKGQQRVKRIELPIGHTVQLRALVSLVPSVPYRA